MEESKKGNALVNVSGTLKRRLRRTPREILRGIPRGITYEKFRVTTEGTPRGMI